MKKLKKTFAAIDIGSNTIHLVVKRIHGKRWVLVYRRTEMMQMGYWVAQTGDIPKPEKKIILQTLKRLIRKARNKGADVILVAGTEALRRARTGKSFVKDIGRSIGESVYLLSKKREAELSFLGARDDLAASGAQIFIDSGGGSTEISLCQGRRRLESVSLPIGSGTLSWNLRHDPPGPLEIALLMKTIVSALASVPRWRPVQAFVTGGSAHHLARMSRSESTVITRAGLNRELLRLLNHKANDIAEKFEIDPIRVRTLAPGALILGAILDVFGLRRMTITLNGLRDGMLDAYLKNRERWRKG